MGFVSMLEDIIEKLGGQLPMVVVREAGREQRPTVQDQREFPGWFVNTVAPMLKRDGIPSYLRQLYLGWIYDLMTQRKSMEETLQEFVRCGMPLVTRHVNEGDSATKAYARKLLKP